jgi:hypothetical protein
MSATNDSDAFYASVSVFHSFSSLMDPALYTPLPDDWTLGLADIVQSTEAIRDNRYKTVNMAGAAVIAAVKNALGGRQFPLRVRWRWREFCGCPARPLACARGAHRHGGVGEG